MSMRDTPAFQSTLVQVRELLEADDLSQIISVMARGHKVTIMLALQPGSEKVWATVLRELAEHLETGGPGQASTLQKTVVN